MPNAKKYTGVLFDLDDTLLSTAETVKQTWQVEKEVLKSQYNLDALELSKHFDKARKNLVYADVFKKILTDLKSTKTAEDLHDLFKKASLEFLKPDPLTVKNLKTLKENHIKIGLITNGTAIRQKEKLDYLQYHDLFDTIVYCGEKIPLKPQTAGFILAGKNLSIPLSDLLMVGDHPINDMQPAVALGMGTLRIKDGNYKSLTSPIGVQKEVNTIFEMWQEIFLKTNTEL